MDANAELMASAPDLLEQRDELLEALEYVEQKSTIDMDDAMIEVVTAAIAKARGETLEGGS